MSLNKGKGNRGQGKAIGNFEILNLLSISRKVFGKVIKESGKDLQKIKSVKKRR